jgi:hypothetical protein
MKLHAMKTNEGAEVSTSCSPHYTTGERAPSNYRTGGWVSPRAGLDAIKKKNVLSLLGIEPKLQRTEKILVCNQDIQRITVSLS